MVSGTFNAWNTLVSTHSTSVFMNWCWIQTIPHAFTIRGRFMNGDRMTVFIMDGSSCTTPTSPQKYIFSLFSSTIHSFIWKICSFVYTWTFSFFIYMKLISLYIYAHKEKHLRPEDPRIKKINLALHTWMLKVANINPSDLLQKLCDEAMTIHVTDEWTDFRHMWLASSISITHTHILRAFLNHTFLKTSLGLGQRSLSTSTRWYSVRWSFWWREHFHQPWDRRHSNWSARNLSRLYSPQLDSPAISHSLSAWY